MQILRAVAAGSRLVVPDQARDGVPMDWFHLMDVCWDQNPNARPDFSTVYRTLGEMWAGLQSDYANTHIAVDPAGIELEGHRLLE